MDDIVHAAFEADAIPRPGPGGATAPVSFALRRLQAERLAEAHLPVLLRMDSDQRLMALIGGVRSAAATAQYLERNLRHWSDHGFGIWILRDPITRQVIGRAGLKNPGNPPIRFAIPYEASRIDPRRSYAMRVRIMIDGKPYFTTDQHYPVLTRGAGNEVEVLLRRAAVN